MPKLRKHKNKIKGGEKREMIIYFILKNKILVDATNATRKRFIEENQYKLRVCIYSLIDEHEHMKISVHLDRRIIDRKRNNG